MKRILLLGLMCISVSVYAQTTVSHGFSFGATLSKDFELTNDFGDVPKENVFQSGRAGYAGEVTFPLSNEIFLGASAMATLGANFRAIPDVGDTEYDEYGNEINSGSGTDNFFVNLIEFNLKAAPLIGYQLQPYRRPYYLTFAVAPITVATDFGLSAGPDDSASIFLGSGFEFGYYWTEGRQTKYSGVVFAFDYKWNQKEDIGFGFQDKDGYWGLDITVSARSAHKF